MDKSLWHFFALYFATRLPADVFLASPFQLVFSKKDNPSVLLDLPKSWRRSVTRRLFAPSLGIGLFTSLNTTPVEHPRT